MFDNHETKLPTYWNTPFSKICLGMKIGHQTRFIVITKHATSLHSLIADGNYRATSLGQNTWKSLLGSFASLQPNCNKEGFNAVSLDPKPESVSLLMNKMTALHLIPESVLVLEDTLITPTRVETRLNMEEITETRTPKPWFTFWCSNNHKELKN